MIRLNGAMFITFYRKMILCAQTKGKYAHPILLKSNACIKRVEIKTLDFSRYSHFTKARSPDRALKTADKTTSNKTLLFAVRSCGIKKLPGIYDFQISDIVKDK